MVMTGYGPVELNRLREAHLAPPHFTAADLYDAVQCILNNTL